MTISPEAVQAALDEFSAWDCSDYPDFKNDVKLALAAAFPIMLREGKYVRVEALLGDKAVEAVTEGLCPTWHDHPCTDCLEIAETLIKAAIETVKKGDV